ncbi:hypothetical protein [Maridesulfovibrio hydrothermalis]|uniref:Uncharacterized protein n=1 Tax=Maridesulfovibrio hydrothermalis AM13 = DSM 14728 TaxID=1121451 RepID=L0RE63_9BACT|nr:hypothetical protein [Maridesulfovibrio hydrothermalis]CCO25083.1 conserved protein of unknown function [Maridesulfovibrio hydrothermalis AM13 = DSM 14728]
MSEGYMEKALLKLAKQLNAYDEASLMDLWSKYEAEVANFQPTRKWEEATIVFGMIQAVKLKNQLFNYNWAESCGPESMSPRPDFVPVKGEDELFTVGGGKKDSGGKSAGKRNRSGDKRSKVLRLKPREDS